jgi:hypothetical protein
MLNKEYAVTIFVIQILLNAYLIYDKKQLAEEGENGLSNEVIRIPKNRGQDNRNHQ